MIKIIIPLSKAALATLSVFIFMASWNNFISPLIFINSDYLKTLPVGLQSFQGMYNTEWTLLMAASVIVMIPVLIVYIFNQRFFYKRHIDERNQGITETGRIFFSRTKL